MCEVLESQEAAIINLFNLSYQIANWKTRTNIKIHLIHLVSKWLYGAPKKHEILLTKGFSLRLKRVMRLRSKLGIGSITKKKYLPYPSKEIVIQLLNLLKQDFTTLMENKGNFK